MHRKLPSYGSRRTQVVVFMAVALLDQQQQHPMCNVHLAQVITVDSEKPQLCRRSWGHEIRGSFINVGCFFFIATTLVGSVDLSKGRSIKMSVKTSMQFDNGSKDRPTLFSLIWKLECMRVIIPNLNTYELLVAMILIHAPREGELYAQKFGHMLCDGGPQLCR